MGVWRGQVGITMEDLIGSLMGVGVVFVVVVVVKDLGTNSDDFCQTRREETALYYTLYINEYIGIYGMPTPGLAR